MQVYKPKVTASRNFVGLNGVQVINHNPYQTTKPFNRSLNSSMRTAGVKLMPINKQTIAP